MTRCKTSRWKVRERREQYRRKDFARFNDRNLTVFARTATSTSAAQRSHGVSSPKCRTTPGSPSSQESNYGSSATCRTIATTLPLTKPFILLSSKILYHHSRIPSRPPILSLFSLQRLTPSRLPVLALSDHSSSRLPPRQNNDESCSRHKSSTLQYSVRNFGGIF